MAFAVWNVVDRGELIDTVYYSQGIDAGFIRNSLILHDGYPDTIELELSHNIPACDNS